MGSEIGTVSRRISPNRIFDLNYDRLTRDPMAAVRDIYAHFGMELSAAAETRMREYLARNPRNRFGQHRYAPEPFGLTPDAVRAAFQPYCDYFGIATEDG